MSNQPTAKLKAVEAHAGSKNFVLRYFSNQNLLTILPCSIHPSKIGIRKETESRRNTKADLSLGFNDTFSKSRASYSLATDKNIRFQSSAKSKSPNSYLVEALTRLSFSFIQNPT